MGFIPFTKTIQYDEPKSLEEAIQKDKHLYDWTIGRESTHKYWRDKQGDTQNQRKKGFQPPILRN